ncbi:hypothetical protein ncot_15810 [Nocardioides sp. JQ2195]|uniref:hypothetical protein n=1 Tax=Nocardioides sp. JQ2195 TaxID=2592334 RepID=UPI00143EF471|nr:hypothetical protein [Nocardioides sp. JQ2195]QIX27888.1 hypothetical protein ncot_15810 [Nocardioides sp. JQ2195]
MMSPLRVLHRGSTAVAAAVLATLVLASCGSSDDSDDAVGDDPSETTSSESTSSPSGSASASSEPDATSAPPSASEPAPSDPAPDSSSESPVKALFLTEKEMPGLNDVTVWTEGRTQPEGPEPFGDCAKFTLVDAGAQDAWVRTFTAQGSQEAAQLIATFADAKSAWRAEQTLRGWHRDCAEEVNAEVERVNPISPVEVDTGNAFTYLVQLGKEDAETHHFNGVAVNRKGKHVSVVLIDTESQDYNYESGQEPAQQAARAVAPKLG